MIAVPHMLFVRSLIAGVPVGLLLTTLAAALAFGGPSAPPPLISVIDAVKQRDRSDLPGLLRYRARDGAQLAYRAYPAADPVGAAVVVHGSVGSSADVHEIAKALRDARVTAYAPDVRGHGASGPRGDIAYIGQLDDDLADFLNELDRQGAPARRVLIGHSAGGGFALRIAAEPLAARFAGAVLLAPYLGDGAPTNRPGIGGWVGVGWPRVVALTMLHDVGVDAWGGLPVVEFAVGPRDAPYVTPAYSFRLAANFGPHRDWRGDIAGARIPLVVLVGADDQVFYPDRYAPVLADAPDARVEVLPGIDHISLGDDPSALAVIAANTRPLLAGARR
ncbi:MAG TPA: alpha/beta fold hydrolase [Stellaceae bacterium]|nr:alpha/beta fold hydrolase [Stellaceae bacterium]